GVSVYLGRVLGLCTRISCVCLFSDHPVLPSFPTRHSSDLSFPPPPLPPRPCIWSTVNNISLWHVVGKNSERKRGIRSLLLRSRGDRKSTRLNSSHVKISYAVFCLKKKKEIK